MIHLDLLGVLYVIILGQRKNKLSLANDEQKMVWLRFLTFRGKRNQDIDDRQLSCSSDFSSLNRLLLITSCASSIKINQTKCK